MKPAAYYSVLGAILSGVVVLVAPGASPAGAASCFVIALVLPKNYSVAFSASVLIGFVLHVVVVPAWDSLSWFPLEPIVAAWASVLVAGWRIASSRNGAECGDRDTGFRAYAGLVADFLLIYHLVRIGLRNADLSTAIPWSLAFAALRWPVLRRRLWRRPNFKKSLATGAVLLVSTVTSAFALEFAARALLPEEPHRGRSMEYDREYVFRLAPNSRSVNRLKVSNRETATIHHAVSAQGFRNEFVPPKQPGEFRVLMLGDSFTQGSAVEVQHAIPQLTQGLLRSAVKSRKITVVNAGIGGSGPIQQLGMLVNRGLALAPDLAVLQLLPVNDVMDSLAIDRVYLQSYNREWVRWIEPLWRSEEWPYNVEHWLRGHSRVYREISRITNKAVPFNFLLRQIRWVGEFGKRIELPPNAPRPFYLESKLSESYPELELGFQRLEEYVLKIRDVCRDNGIDFAVYIMPGHNALDDETWDGYVEEYGEIWTRYSDFDRINAFIEREKIATFDIREALSTYDHIGDYYYLLDGHLTPAGNRIVAEEIREFILDRYFAE